MMRKPEQPEQDAASPPEGDIAFVRRAKDGDNAAFEELIRLHYRKIYALLYNMTSNREDTEDLLQEVFLKAHKSLPRFEGQSSFYTWIYRIAINHTLNFLQKRKRGPTMSLNAMNEEIEADEIYRELVARESPVRDASLAELQEQLNKALMSLSESHRAVVVMFDVQGMSHEEIAEAMGCSPGTVRSRLFYARRYLQEQLKDLVP